MGDLSAAAFVARVREARIKAGRSQAWVASRMVDAGQDAWRQTTVGKVETGQRALSLDEAYALAVLLGVDLVPVAERATAGEPADAGRVEAAVRADVELLGDLSGVEPSLAETAYRLASLIDSIGGADDVKAVPALTRELRATLATLVSGRQDEDDDDDDDLASPE